METVFKFIKLSQVRISKGLSARELSSRINKNPGYINSIECGKITPSIKSLFDICRELDIKPSTLFDVTSDESTIKKNCYDEISKLNEEDLNILFTVITRFKVGK